MDAEILNELLWIKWILIVFCCAALLSATLITTGVAYFVRGVRRMSGTCGLPDNNVQTLFEQGKTDEAISAGEARKKLYPRDAGNLWSLAAAYRAKSNFPAALQLLRTVNEIQPEWKERYTAARIRDIENALAAAAGGTAQDCDAAAGSGEHVSQSGQDGSD